MKPKVIFVAGLNAMPKGEMGGQLAVASTLLHSELAQHVEFVPLSSTMASIPPPPLVVRAAAAARRVATFARSLVGADAVLIFISDGLSLVEKGAMAVMARGAGKAVVVRFSSGALPAQCERHPALRHWLQLVLRAAHFVCVQGPYWGRFYASFPDARSKIVEIANGTQLPSRRRPHAATPTKRIAFVGWMYREKGIFEALDVIERLRRRHPEVKLCLAGGGRDVAEFQSEVARRGLTAHVEVLGWQSREQVIDLLTSADAFFLPTHYEGLPNAMLEAMACAVPVVVTRVGAIPDVIEHGRTGFLVDPKDVPSMTEALDVLLSHPDTRDRVGNEGRRLVEAEFDIEKVWPRYRDTIDRAIQLARAGRA